MSDLDGLLESQVLFARKFSGEEGEKVVEQILKSR